MPKVDIKINRSPNQVWKALVEESNWKKWWGGDLQRVSPSWQKGAKLIWANGNRSNLSMCSAEKGIQITSPFIQHTFSLKPKGRGSTNFIVDFSPRGGANFSDGGRAHGAKLASGLKKFKKIVELKFEQDASRNKEPASKNKLQRFWENLKDQLF